MKKFTRHPQGKSIFVLLVVLALSVTLWSGCEVIQGPQELAETQQEFVLSPQNPLVKAAMEVQNRHTEELLAKPGIVGTATTMTEDGKPAIVIYSETVRLAKAAALPATLENVPVIVEAVGEIKAVRGPPAGGGVDPTGRFDRPVPIGVSTGHPDITAGTIGCRVKSGNNVYALSNNHVYANENLASIGDAVIQPGTFDGGSSPADDIGNLSDFAPIVFSTSANNVIDAAIASTTTALLSNSTPSDGYGTPRSQTVAASAGMRVMQYGRTTGETKGTIDAINATVNIGYDTGVARFVNQIIIKPGSFGAGGDSGSLVVVQKGGNARKPVGLYYAGSSQIGIANPIDDVLNEFGVTIDGN